MTWSDDLTQWLWDQYKSGELTRAQILDGVHGFHMKLWTEEDGAKYVES